MNTHDIDIELPLPAPPKIGFLNYVKHGKKIERYGQDCMHAAIEPYAKRIAELEAARIAYASEFAPDEDGNPDVGSIHENIRKLKANLEATLQSQDREDLLKALVIAEDMLCKQENALRSFGAHEPCAESAILGAREAIDHARRVQGEGEMKTRNYDWYDTEKGAPAYGFQVFMNGEWAHPCEDGRLLVFPTKEERDTKRKEVSKIKEKK